MKINRNSDTPSLILVNTCTILCGITFLFNRNTYEAPTMAGMEELLLFFLIVVRADNCGLIPIFVMVTNTVYSEL